MNNVIICKKNEQAIPAPIEARFSHLHRNYCAQLELSLAFTLASVPCEKCGKSTRDMLKGIDIIIDSDDMKVNVMDIYINKLPRNMSTLEPTTVSVVVACIIEYLEEILDDNTSIEIDPDSRLGESLDAYVRDILVGKIFCNDCLTDDNLHSVLSD